VNIIQKRTNCLLIQCARTKLQDQEQAGQNEDKDIRPSPRPKIPTVTSKESVQYENEK